MKTRLLITGAVLLLTVLCLYAGSSNAKLNFEKALLLEEVNRKFQEAITLYQKVVTESGNDEALAAQAQLHLGMCYEKLANQEARKAYQTVIDKYPSQQDAVRIARQRLASLNSGHQAGQKVTVREFSDLGETNSGKISGPAQDPANFVTTRDGQTFVYTDWKTGDLVVKNYSTGKVQALYGVHDDGKQSFMKPVLSPDEKRLAYLHYIRTNSNKQGKVARLTLDALEGGNQEVLYESEMNLFPQDWSPDGKNILINLEAADKSVSLATVGTKDKKLKRLVTLNYEYHEAKYSPDGRFIAYDSTKDGDSKIYLLSSDGLEERVLVDSVGEDGSPLWSLDGRFLLFKSNRSGSWGLYGLSIQGGLPKGDPFLIKPNIGGGALRSMTTEGKLFYGESVSEGTCTILKRGDQNKLYGAWILAIGEPNFAPDGSSLVYASTAVGQATLRIVTLDGTILRDVNLRPEFQYLERPVFSPDGKKIALQAQDRKFLSKILVLSAETGALLKVFHFEPGSYGKQSGWSKDSRLLYVRVGKDNETQGARLEAIDVEIETRISSPLPREMAFMPGGVSPDGKFLANVLYSDPISQKPCILLRSLPDGTDKMVKADDLKSHTVWDFDSRHLFYSNNEQQVYRLSIDDGTKEVLPELKGALVEAVSRDGKYLACLAGASDRRIWVVENFLPKVKTELAGR